MTNQYEKLVEQQNRLKQKVAREDFKLRQAKYYENRQARKARSRRLIQKGALLEKYFQADNLSVAQTEELLKIFADYVNEHKPDNLKNDQPNN
ncbi:hypothetical protein [Liquorilactobacillus mali]|uniref:hypothetical protein n=1 Tax=Liquorilactobacillus mali TaxID=1618 RepID=UPI002954A625|nr:hypothetical protein [Liquorilactobacillus mali]MDV7757997.1 hypothetical protein [Liquorilactobacillus mali]